MQSSSLDFSILNPVKDSCINNIQRQITTPGKYFSEVDDLIDLLNEGQHTINVTDGIKNQFETQVRKPYLEKLIENLNNRFPRVELLSAFSIFNPEFLLSTPARCQLFPNLSQLLVRGLLLPIAKLIVSVVFQQ